MLGMSGALDTVSELAERWLNREERFIEFTDPVTKKPLSLRACTVTALMHANLEHRPARTIIMVKDRPQPYFALEKYWQIKEALGLTVSDGDKRQPDEQSNGLIVLPPPGNSSAN